MKKYIIGMTIASIALCALAGCGKSEEECFNEAKQRFDNFTVTINLEAYGRDNEHVVCEIDGTNCKYTRSGTSFLSSYWYKEEDNKIYEFQEQSHNWLLIPNCSTFNDLLMNEGVGYVGIFEQIFYDDFIEEDDFLKMNNNAISYYSNKLSNNTILCSAKIRLRGNQFDIATAIFQTSTTRLQLDYTFFNFGSTSVILPE